MRYIIKNYNKRLANCQIIFIFTDHKIVVTNIGNNRCS